MTLRFYTVLDRRVYEFIRGSPVQPAPLGERTIAAAVGASRRQTQYALQRLQDQGRLRRELRQTPGGQRGVSVWHIGKE